MNFRKFLTGIFVATMVTTQAADIRYVGGDISLLPDYQKAGTQYKDETGNDIDLLPYLYSLGMNAMRVRLFVDPDTFIEEHPGSDANACQSLPYIIPLCQDIIGNGFELMLDFHYSDTWADPGKQWIPKSWEGLSDDELVKKIYDYTKETLETLALNGIVPTFIQPGNEISYGMLWGPYGKDNNNNHVWDGSSDASWQRFGRLLRSAISACREVCPEAQIVIHTERVEQVNVLTNFYEKMQELDIDYDIIGLSYYPYFHGNMSVLDSALTKLESEFAGKPIMIVETGFPYEWEVPGTDHKVDYEYSLDGQNVFAHELVDTLLSHPSVNGLFWWWLEYNAYGTSLTGWYNAPLFNSHNGQATPALKTICSFGSGSAFLDSFSDDPYVNDNKWYDLNGILYDSPSPGKIYIHNGKKIIVSQ